MSHKEFVARVLNEYRVKGGGSATNRARLLGAMEAALTFAGVFMPGVPFYFRPVKRGFLDRWLGGFPNHETYTEHVLRIADEFVSTPDEGSMSA